MINKLKNITTAEYCSEQLCNALGMQCLADTPPSLLIKINDTYVGEKLYMNFLRISIDEGMVSMVRKFSDMYLGMLSSDTRIVVDTEEANGQFMYHGFYKQLFDTYVIQKGIRSKVLIDFTKGNIKMLDLSLDIKGMHRRDKALYVLLLIESENGGIDFSFPKSINQKHTYESRMREIQRKYEILYHAFNGSKDKVPHLDEPEIRRPIISNIRKCISNLSDVLHCADNYNIRKNSYNRFCVDLSSDLIYIDNYTNKERYVPLKESTIYKKLKGELK